MQMFNSRFSQKLLTKIPIQIFSKIPADFLDTDTEIDLAYEIIQNFCKIPAAFLDTDTEIDLAYENIQILQIPVDFLDTDNEILSLSWKELIFFCKCLLSFLSELLTKLPVHKSSVKSQWIFSTPTVKPILASIDLCKYSG